MLRMGGTFFSLGFACANAGTGCRDAVINDESIWSLAAESAH